MGCLSAENKILAAKVGSFSDERMQADENQANMWKRGMSCRDDAVLMQVMFLLM